MANPSDRKQTRHPREGGGLAGLPDTRLRGYDVAGVLLLLAAFGLGLFFEGYRDLHYAPATLCIVLFACLSIIPAFWRGLEVPVAPAALAVLLFWIYVTLSLTWSSVPFASLVTYLVFLAGPLPFFAILLSPRREALGKALGVLLLSALGVLAAWALIQYAFFQDIFGNRAHHPLPSPNNLAGLLNLGLLPALALFLSRTTKDAKFFALLALTLLFFAGLAATESRGAVIGALLAAGLLVFILRPSGQNLIFISIGALLVFAAVGAINHMGFAGRMADLAAINGDGPALARIAVWQNALRMLGDHLLPGTGLGTFYLYYPAYRVPGADNSSGSWAHMDPLQFGIEMGVLAPLLFYAIAVFATLRTMAALRGLPADAPERTGIAALFCALAAVGLQTHVDFNLYIMPILIVTGVWLALWYQLTAKALPSYKTLAMDNWQRPFMAVVTIAVAALIGGTAVSSAAGQYHLLRAHELIKQGLPEQFAAAIEDAERWAPRSFVDPELHLASFYIDLLGKNAAALFTPEEQQSLYIQTLALLDTAGKYNPPWGEVDYKRGLLYAAINTDFEPEARQKALESLERAVQKDRTHFRARYALAEQYIQRGRVEDADAMLKNGLAYPHDAETDAQFKAERAKLSGLVNLKRGYDIRKTDAP